MTAVKDLAEKAALELDVRLLKDAPPTQPKTVYQCIAAVSAEVAKIGVAKDRKNKQQDYNFRGIDDAYNALAPIISAQGLVILPKITHREVTERASKSGGTLFWVVVQAEYRLVSAHDNSEVTVGPFFGEAMDSGDKATNKAMSTAFKYMVWQTFCVPTQGDHDTENQTHEVVPMQQPIPVPPKPAGYDDWVVDMELAAENGLVELLKAWKGPDKADEATKTLLAARRDYRTTHEREKHEALKVKSQKVTA